MYSPADMRVSDMQVKEENLQLVRNVPNRDVDPDRDIGSTANAMAPRSATMRARIVLWDPD